MKYPSVNNLQLEPIFVSMRVVLFGSRAPGGSPRDNSDLDLALVVEDDVSNLVLSEVLKERFPNATIDVFPHYGANPSLLHLLVMNESEYLDEGNPLSQSVRNGLNLTEHSLFH